MTLNQSCQFQVMLHLIIHNMHKDLQQCQGQKIWTNLIEATSVFQKNIISVFQKKCYQELKTFKVQHRKLYNVTLAHHVYSRDRVVQKGSVSILYKQDYRTGS